MTPLFFAAKRSFHSSLRVARELLAPFGLTPARFDLLCAISDAKRPVTQSDLREILGVSGPTISRMLRSLEDLGLVVRSRYWGDMRQRLLQPTMECQMRMRAVLESVTRAGFVRLAVDSALASEVVFDGLACEREVASAYGLFRRFSHGLGDRATLEYLLGVAA